MALVKCTECFHSISKTATHCPNCGAKIRRTTLITKIIAGLFAIWVLSIIFDEDKTHVQNEIKAETSASIQVSQEQLENEQRRKECEIKIESKKNEYHALMAAHNYGDAARVLTFCAGLLADTTLHNLVAEAEIKSYLQDIKNPKTPLRAKAFSIELMRRNYPEKAIEYETLFVTILDKVDKQERLEEAKRRKKEGVSIGMTPDEVRASSWGKPDSINRSTYAWGQHEQWVYGGGNYLYFENGKLTSIQN